MSGRKVTGLPLPDTPREAPPEIHSLVEAIENELGDSRVLGAVSALGLAFDYLTRYFAAVAGATAQVLSLESGTAVTAAFEDARQQLKDRLLVLGEKSTDPLSKLVRSVFFVGATRKTPTPRRHARLLDLGGIPIRGYLSLGEWIALTPDDKELSSDSKANRELLRYLPILKEWVTATKPFFLDCEQSVLRQESETSVSFEITLGETRVKAGPVELPEGLRTTIFAHTSAAGSSEVKPDPISAKSEEESAQQAEEDLAAEPVSSSGMEAFPEVEEASEPIAGETVEGVELEPPDALHSGQEVDRVSQTIRLSPEVLAVQQAESPVGEEPESDKALPSDADIPDSEVEARSPSPTQRLTLPEELGERQQADTSVESEQTEGPAETVVVEVEEPEQTKEPVETAEVVETEEAEQTEGPAETVVVEIEEPEQTEEPAETAQVVETEEVEQTEEPVETVVVEIEEPEQTEEPAETVAVEFEEAEQTAEPVETVAVEVEEPEQAEEPVETAPENGEPELPQLAKEPEAVQETARASTLPARPADDELAADPVLAALHAGNLSRTESNAPVHIVPMPTGPAPEFFDEIAVESDYPEVLRMAITDLNGAIESNDSILICGQLQRCFDILIQLLAGLAAAILREIDSDALAGLDVEEERFVDLDQKIELIVTSLSALEEYWENNDAAMLLWSLFYDTLLPATDPNCTYLQTRLLGVEGIIPDPYIEFSEFCQRVPGKGKLQSQDHCKKVVHFYLPVLDFWLENTMPLFLECEFDAVEEEDGAAISWAASVAGATLDGTGPGFWIEVDPSRWNLPRPELAPVYVSGEAPEVLLPVFEELNVALENLDFAAAGLQSRIALDFLIQYFAGCVASLWRQQGQMSEQALALFYPEASLEEKERLLLLGLGGISSESNVGAELCKVFATTSLQYRALSQKGQPQGMGQISEWAVARDEVTEDDLVTYLPLLRSWIGASNPWFASGEQLFEEPSKGGILEGVVALADQFLEMVDPEYVIQLPRECLDLVAPTEQETQAESTEEAELETPFTGQLPQLPILTQGPPVLVGHLGRLLESAEDRRTSNAWLGSAIEYLIQYFAGMCTTVLGAAEAPLPANVMEYFAPNSSLRQRELLLLAAVEHLKKAATGTIQESLRDVFLKPDGGYRRHTKYLGAMGAGSLDENEMLLSYWCRIRHQAGSLTTEDLHFGISTLNSWIDAAKPFFASCEHYAEEPGADGQEEMVVELADDYLDMVLPDYAIQIPARGYYEVLYKEPDDEAKEDMEAYFPQEVRPTLLGPEEVVLGGVAGDDSEELLGAAEVLGAQDLFGGIAEPFDSSDLFAGSAVESENVDVEGLFSGAAPSVEKSETDALKDGAAEPSGPPPEERPMYSLGIVTKKRKKKSRKQELGSAVLELYKKERVEKARKRAEARARKSQDVPSRVKYTLQYRGLKNSKQLGGRGHFGLIELSNVGGGELKGTIEPAHPCVRTQPTRFERNEVLVTYQVDPADMPSTGRVGLTINTRDERVELRLDELVPSSWLRERTTPQALGLLTVPSLVYGVWLIFLMAVLLGPGVKESVEFFGFQTDLEKMPWGFHLKLWSFSVLAILPGASAIPGVIKSLFARMDYSVQEESRWWLPGLMMIPTLIMVLVLYGTSYWTFNVQPGRLPPLASRVVLSVLTFGLNLLATSLFSLQTTMWWEENADTTAARRTFVGFLATSIILGVFVTFFMW